MYLNLQINQDLMISGIYVLKRQLDVISHLEELVIFFLIILLEMHHNMN